MYLCSAEIQIKWLPLILATLEELNGRIHRGRRPGILIEVFLEAQVFTILPDMIEPGNGRVVARIIKVIDNRARFVRHAPPAIDQPHQPVVVRILSAPCTATGRAARGGRAESRGEQCALRGKTIEMWGFHGFAIAAQGPAKIVTNDVNDVGLCVAHISVISNRNC